MIYTSFILTIVICFMLILYHWKQNKAIVLFVYVLLSIGQRSLIYLLIESGTDRSLLAYLYIHNLPFALLMGPALYYYSLSIINNRLYVNKLLWVTLIPSALAFYSLSPYFGMPMAEKIHYFKETAPLGVENDFFAQASSLIPIRFFQNIVLFINTTYFFYCIYLLIKARASVNKIIKKRINNFLGILAVITFLTYLPATIVYFFVYSKSNFFLNGLITTSYFPPLKYLSLFTLLTPILFLFFPNWLYAEQFNGNQQSSWDNFLSKYLDPAEIKKVPSAQQSISEDLELNRIIEFLKTDQQYLNPQLTVHEISKSLDIPQARITYYFNKVIKTPFPRFRNQLRVEHAIELLNQNAHQALSIEGIAMQSGFKNKSTFYIAFKEEKGMTPMDWLRVNAAGV